MPSLSARTAGLRRIATLSLICQSSIFTKKKTAKENSGWTRARKGAGRARQTSEEQVLQKATKMFLLLYFQKRVAIVGFTALLILFFWRLRMLLVFQPWGCRLGVDGEGGADLLPLEN